MDKIEFQELFERASTSNEILQAIYTLSSKIDANQIQTEKETAEKKRTESIRFWITFVITLIGSLAAVGGLVATIVLR